MNAAALRLDQGRRIMLRPWLESDLPFLTALRNDRALQAQLMASARGSDESAVRAWLDRRTAGGGFSLAIIALAGSGEPAGFLQTEPEGTDGTLRFGLCLAPAFQGRGHGQAALSMLIDGMIRERRPRLICTVDTANRNAITLYRRLGFRFAALPCRTIAVNGEARRALTMQRPLLPEGHRRSLRLVISQSMYFPWAGMLDQMRLADVFVHYDDVAFSKGSFTNRVQVKMPDGPQWMTVPLAGHRLGQAICDTGIADVASFSARHLSLLERSLAGQPHAGEALALARDVLSGSHANLGALARSSMMSLADYFGLSQGTVFLDAADLHIGGRSSERVAAIAEAFGATDYVTGHGARRYLDLALFDKAGISVSCMDYRFTPWPQAHGAFTPHVTALDLAAAAGPSGARHLTSGTIILEDKAHEPD